MCLDEDGILVGTAATRCAQFLPESFEAAPKTLLGQDNITLGGTEVPVVDLVAAVLQEVLTKACARARHQFDAVLLTHPEGWGRHRLNRLREAAIRAGVNEQALQLLPEAEAAARYYTRHQANLAPGAHIAVFDFGGGTCDVAVLGRTADGFDVLGSAADPFLGGAKFDAAIWTWLAAQYDDLSVIQSLDVAAQLTLREQIRTAKEDLSSAPKTRIAVPGFGHMQLTRAEYDTLIFSEVARAVELTRRTMISADIDPGATTLYLTGGSSLTPLVHDELAKITTLGTLAADPKTVVATGALYSPATPASKPTNHAPPADGLEGASAGKPHDNNRISCGGLSAPEPPPTNSATTPGWFADPAGHPGLRYFDGNEWTEHRSRPGGRTTTGRNALAISAPIIAIVGWPFLALGSIAAIILGNIALKQIVRNGQSGQASAKAGIGLGIVGVIAYVILVVVGAR